MSAISEKDLDNHYQPSRWSHRMSSSEVIKYTLDFGAKGTKTAQWTLDAETEISYGDSERQKFDIYHKKNSPKKGAPIFVFLHGGYWQIQEVTRDNSGFVAIPLCEAGASVAVVDYDLCPDVSLDTIILQVKKALHLIIKLAKERQSSGIYLAGHSAGGHLGAMMLMSAFSDYDAFDSELIKGAVLISGVYDLVPLTKTTVNNPLKLTEEDARRLSPMQFLDEISQHSKERQVLLVVGEYDPPEFHRQSAEMEKALRQRGVKANYLEVSDTDHFSVIEKLIQPDYTITKEILRMMKL